MVAKVDKIVKRGQIYWVDFGTDKRIQKRNDESEDEIMKYIPRNKYYQ